MPYAGIHRGRMEVEAEGSAAIVGAAQGFDTLGWSADYMAGWSARHPDLVQETAAKVVKVAQEMLEAFDVAPRFGTEQEQVGDIITVELPEPGIPFDLA